MRAHSHADETVPVALMWDPGTSVKKRLAGGWPRLLRTQPMLNQAWKVVPKRLDRVFFFTKILEKVSTSAGVVSLVLMVEKLLVFAKYLELRLLDGLFQVWYWRCRWH